MFEDAIFKKDESEVKRSFFTLPLAFAFQISVIVGFILFGIFTSTYIPAPEKNAVFEPIIIVPPPPPPLGTANGDNKPLKSVQQPKIEKNEVVFPEQKSDSSKNGTILQPADNFNQAEGRGPRGDENGDDFMNKFDQPPLTNDNSKTFTPPQISDISLIKALLAINTPKPAYPEPLLRMGVKGRVVALITVDQTGRVTNIEIEQSTNPLFEESVKETVKKWRFTSPVDKQGQKVSVTFRQVFVFNF